MWQPLWWRKEILINGDEYMVGDFWVFLWLCIAANNDLLGGLCAENEIPHPRLSASSIMPNTTAANEPSGVIDDVLTFILLSIAVSGGDFKSDCYKWWSKAVRLAFSLRLNREDESCSGPVTPCANPLCSCHRDQAPITLQGIEQREERRRVFWLLYSLDRHLSLSFNTILTIPDSYCEVFSKSSSQYAIPT